jgi:hypothetical protein
MLSLQSISLKSINRPGKMLREAQHDVLEGFCDSLSSYRCYSIFTDTAAPEYVTVLAGVAEKLAGAAE